SERGGDGVAGDSDLLRYAVSPAVLLQLKLVMFFLPLLLPMLVILSKDADRRAACRQHRGVRTGAGKLQDVPR
ncbi:MAG: hypothetical protein ABF297_00355, partial [Thiogranum sp.]